MFDVPPPSSSAGHPLFSFSFFFFRFFFVFFCFFHPFSTPNFEAKLQSSDFEVRSSNFEHKLQCSCSPPPPPPPATHCFSFFFPFVFCFLLFFFLLFFSTPNFEARLQSSNFEVRSWNFEVWVPSSNFEVPSSNFEHRLQSSMFSPPLPASHPLFFFLSFFVFFCFFSPCFFHAKTWKPDFKVPTSKFEVGTLKFGFQVPTSKFEVRTSNTDFNVQCSPPPPPATHCFLFLFWFFVFFCFFSPFFPRQISKPDFKVPTSKLEHLSEHHGRAHPHVAPEVARPFAISHDLKVHQCLCQIIGVDPDDVSRGALQQSTLPFHLGGLGLPSAVKTRDGAYWASWADAVSTIQKKDPDLAATILAGFHSEGEGCFAVANQCAERLVALGVELPTWDAVVAGATPDHIHNVEEPCVHQGWQQHVPNTVEKVFNTEAVWPLETNEVALALSQSGPLAGVPFHCPPTSYATRMDSEIFRTLLLRRLRLPLPLNARVCRCGRLRDCLGHHRSARAVSGALVR